MLDLVKGIFRNTCKKTNKNTQEVFVTSSLKMSSKSKRSFFFFFLVQVEKCVLKNTDSLWLIQPTLAEVGDGSLTAT